MFAMGAGETGHGEGEKGVVSPILGVRGFTPKTTLVIVLSFL